MYKFEKVVKADKKHQSKVVLEIPGTASEEELLIEFRAFMLACGFEIKGEIMVQKEEDQSPVDI